MSKHKKIPHMELREKKCGNCEHFNDGYCRKHSRLTGYFDSCTDHHPRGVPIMPAEITVAPAGMKKCRRCGRVLPLGEFSRHWKSTDGCKNVCKTCQSALLRSALGSKAKADANKAPDVELPPP